MARSIGGHVAHFSSFQFSPNRVILVSDHFSCGPHLLRPVREVPFRGGTRPLHDEALSVLQDDC